jgi:hypothetical protein
MKFSAYVMEGYFYLKSPFYSDLLEYVYRYDIWGSYNCVNEDSSVTVLDAYEMPYNKL